MFDPVIYAVPVTHNWLGYYDDATRRPSRSDELFTLSVVHDGDRVIYVFGIPQTSFRNPTRTKKLGATDCV